MPLEPPPDDPRALAAFPARVVAAGPGGQPLYRMFRHRDPTTGAVRSPFFFTSAGGGRYDLPAPSGTCYLATTPLGAWLETFRNVGTVALEDVQSRRLLATRPPRPIRAANLLAAAARRFGLTAEIHTTADYGLTRRWAERLHAARFRALWGQVRHDPTLRHRSLTLFDQAGAHTPFGWRWVQQVDRIDEDRRLMRMVAARGFRIVEIPYDVPFS
jgi:hypothetical protein